MATCEECHSEDGVGEPGVDLGGAGDEDVDQGELILLWT